MTLNLIMCSSCGNPTGRVVSNDELEAIPLHERVCRNCQAVPGMAATAISLTCPNCGGERFDLQRRRTEYWTGVMFHDGGALPTFGPSDHHDTDSTWTNPICSNCEYELIQGTHYDRVSN